MWGEHMSQCVPWLLLSLGIAISHSEEGLAAHLQEETALLKAETLPEELVQGVLVKVENDYLFIEGQTGEQFMVHVDESTAWGPVRTGDRVKAYVTDAGHVTILERQDQPPHLHQ
jgi:hypothetical protein